jgi:membrane protease YdiL (CAAX protease family)
LDTPGPAFITGPGRWLRLVLGLAAVFALFHLVASRVGSMYGEKGLAIALLVVTATALVDRLLFRPPPQAVIRHLGLGPPRVTGVLVSGGVALLLVSTGLAASRWSGMTLTLVAGWAWMLPGLFAQGGIAEEVLFRGFLFRYVRSGRSFWRAASVSMLPFVAVHLLLFLTMPWPIAVASVLLAVVVSFPLARLYELGGGTIWAPALLHFVIQGTVKVVVVSGGVESFAIIWMIASAVVPLLIFVRYPARS